MSDWPLELANRYCTAYLFLCLCYIGKFCTRLLVIVVMFLVIDSGDAEINMRAQVTVCD